MTEDNDFKRLVRKRMEKTGEAYTTARTHLIARKAAALPSDYAALAGMSDDAVAAKTGRTWPEWVRLLDGIDAQALPHGEAAAWLGEHEGLSPWWSQTVTVAYERIRGLREIGQRSDGTFEVTKSKTFAQPLAKLYQSFATKRARGRWMPGANPTVRSARRDRSVRFTWNDGTSVEISFTAKGDRKTQVSVEHGRLPDKTTAAALKVFWADHLEALKALLEDEA